jgi:hypothetical protein
MGFTASATYLAVAKFFKLEEADLILQWLKRTIYKQVK